jgi:hypothetical protein
MAARPASNNTVFLSPSTDRAAHSFSLLSHTLRVQRGTGDYSVVCSPDTMWHFHSRIAYHAFRQTEAVSALRVGFHAYSYVPLVAYLPDMSISEKMPSFFLSPTVNLQKYLEAKNWSDAFRTTMDVKRNRIS